MNKVEKYIQDYTRRCSNSVPLAANINGFESWLTPDHARKVAEIAREEAIEEACKWLEDNLIFDDDGHCYCDICSDLGLIKDFCDYLNSK